MNTTTERKPWPAPLPDMDADWKLPVWPLPAEPVQPQQPQRFCEDEE